MKTQDNGPLTPMLDAIVLDTMSQIEWMKLSENRLTVEAARMFVRQFGLFTRHSRRCWAYVVANCPHVEVRKFVTRHNLYEEEAMETSHYDLLARMGLRLGLKQEEIDDAKPLPTTLVALHSWEALTKNRDWVDGLTARSEERRVGKECRL